MSIPAANATYVLGQFDERVGDAYVYGGDYSQVDLTVGADCSYVVGWVLEALTKGSQAMSWAHNVSTESWTYDYSTNTPAAPGTVGPYGTIAVASDADVPADAALIINIMHGGGGASSHMNCQLAGQYLESNGTYGSCTGAKATPDGSSEWTDHWYLPGPIDGTVNMTAPTQPADTLFADVSEFQVVVDDSYPYLVLSIRVCDGTYQDKNFAENYSWMRKALDSGKLVMGIIYCYVETANWQGTSNTLKSVINDNGGLHDQCVLMLDVESGGNAAGGDASTQIDALYADLVSFAGGNPLRVIGYGNVSDLNSIWITKPNGERIIVASYGSNPAYPNEIAHQYTDGQGYGGGLPEGCAPFGTNDMNSADGLTANQFAAACGITTTTGVNAVTAPTIQQDLDGVDATGAPQPWRKSVLLATYKGAGVANLPVPFEVPWPTTSDFDPTTVLGTILTQLTTDGRTAFDLLVDIDAKLTQLVAGSTVQVQNLNVVPEAPTPVVTPVVVQPVPEVVPVAPAPAAPVVAPTPAPLSFLEAIEALFTTFEEVKA